MTKKHSGVFLAVHIVETKHRAMQSQQQLIVPICCFPKAGPLCLHCYRVFQETLKYGPQISQNYFEIGHYAMPPPGGCTRKLLQMHNYIHSGVQRHHKLVQKCTHSTDSDVQGTLVLMHIILQMSITF